MDPIISPWLIYAIGIVNGVSIISLILAIIFGLATIISTICYFVSKYDGPRDYYGERQERAYVSLGAYIKRFAIVCGICSLIAVLTPSQKTIVGMIIAENVTVNNVNAAVKIGKDIKTSIFNDIVFVAEKISNRNMAVTQPDSTR